MRNFLEDFKTLVAELIGVIGGLIWAINTKWDYEPVILLSISTLGLVVFIIFKLLNVSDKIPKVVMELTYDGGFRPAPKMIANVSPQDESGYYLQEQCGIYYYEVEHKYILIVRNNSPHNAYNLKIFKDSTSVPLEARNVPNELEPLIINDKKEIRLKYKRGFGMTTKESMNILNNPFDENIMKMIFVAEYTNDNDRKFYTILKPIKYNVFTSKFRDKSNYTKLLASR